MYTWLISGQSGTGKAGLPDVIVQGVVYPKVKQHPVHTYSYCLPSQMKSVRKDYYVPCLRQRVSNRHWKNESRDCNATKCQAEETQVVTAVRQASCHL